MDQWSQLPGRGAWLSVLIIPEARCGTPRGRHGRGECRLRKVQQALLKKIKMSQVTNGLFPDLAIFALGVSTFPQFRGRKSFRDRSSLSSARQRCPDIRYDVDFLICGYCATQRIRAVVAENATSSGFCDPISIDSAQIACNTHTRFRLSFFFIKLLL